MTFGLISPTTFSRCWTCLWLSLWTTLNIWHVTPPSWALTTWMSLSECGRSMTQPHGMFQPTHFLTSPARWRPTLVINIVTEFGNSWEKESHYVRTQRPSQVRPNQIKSLLLSHHHSTCALVSEIDHIEREREIENIPYDNVWLKISHTMPIRILVWMRMGSCPPIRVHSVHNTNVLSKLSSCMCHVLLVLSAADGFPIRICTICCELSRPPLA